MCNCRRSLSNTPSVTASALRPLLRTCNTARSPGRMISPALDAATIPVKPDHARVCLQWLTSPPQPISGRSGQSDPLGKACPGHRQLPDRDAGDCRVTPGGEGLLSGQAGRFQRQRRGPATEPPRGAREDVARAATNSWRRQPIQPAYAAQHESLDTSLLKVCAASLIPSDSVRYG
jgi:hypothetical protein